jgi:heptosyltransferase-1
MEIKKALTFRASSIGDCLMGAYLLENVHAQYPQARLGIVVASRAGMIRDLLAAYPWLEVIEANRRHPSALLSLWKNFRESDLVVTQYTGKQGGSFSLMSKFFARLLAKRGGLVGFTDVSPWNKLLYSKLVPVRGDQAVAEHDRSALRAAGVSIALPFPTVEYIKDPNVLKKFNLQEGKYIIVHLFAGNAKRGLHPDKKRKLLSALAEKIPQTTFVLSGGKDDREESSHISEGINVKVIAGEANLQAMMNLIAHSSAVVSVDTGLAHITAQLRKPLTVLRTCLGRNWWFPEQYGADAPITVLSNDTPCEDGHQVKDYPECINGISIEDVVRAVEGIK